jgi:PadR family transcriptional regulator, regulatory protein AphA
METNTLTATEGALLGMLAHGERSGYDLSRRVEDSIGYLWSPSRSQIYRVLPRLVDRGLARSREVEQRGRPDKALYALTPVGRRALRAWLEEAEDEPADRTVYPLKLFFCDFAPPQAALAQLAAYRRYLERLLTRYRDIEARPTDSRLIYPRIVLAHGITRVESTLAWIDDTTATIQPHTAERAAR